MSPALLMVTGRASNRAAQSAGNVVPKTSNDLALPTALPEVAPATPQHPVLTMPCAPVSVLTDAAIMAGGHSDLAAALRSVPGRTLVERGAWGF